MGAAAAVGHDRAVTLSPAVVIQRSGRLRNLPDGQDVPLDHGGRWPHGFNRETISRYLPLSYEAYRTACRPGNVTTERYNKSKFPPLKYNVFKYTPFISRKQLKLRGLMTILQEVFGLDMGASGMAK